MRLRNDEGDFVNPYLWFMYIQLPRFDLDLSELRSRLDQWLFILKNLKKMDMAPEVFTKDSLFFQFLEEAELAKLSPLERRVYEQRLKEHRDLYNVIAFAEEKALKRGMEKGITQTLQKMVLKLFEQAMPLDLIAQVCEMSEAEVREVLSEAGLL